ncbi:hypothetical protein [Cytobacillus sp. IB215665]|uniref:hypothetical protein n=1 Tax=Cytobacillus sp. IB215665 TaxID=3097357 RepID=UPI002A0EE610|nr:hypothetical protein [Cytobacillus sp. IB215665]MDX8364134.1 hypothetical protein [Cytobacillus sp. IB215665]
MDLVSIITATLLVGVCSYLVISPLLSKKNVTFHESMIDEVDTIKKEEIFATLNELEMDYNMQKLSTEDYEKLKSNYEKMLLPIMAEETIVDDVNVAHTIKNIPKQVKKDIENEIANELDQVRKQRGGK